MSGRGVYSYTGNDPLDGADPSGNACVAANAASDYCTRAILYSEIDGVVSSKTRFFAAASATVQLIANMSIPILGTFGTSASSREFLSTLSANLQKTNLSLEKSIIQGLSIPGTGTLDQKMVHVEQTQVQSELDDFAASNPGDYKDLITHMNSMLNPTGNMQRAANYFPSDRAYTGILNSVRAALGRDIDFSKESDREAIGNAVINDIRKNGGCDVTGSRLKSC